MAEPHWIAADKLKIWVNRIDNSDAASAVLDAVLLLRNLPKRDLTVDDPHRMANRLEAWLSHINNDEASDIVLEAISFLRALPKAQDIKEQSDE